MASSFSSIGSADPLMPPNRMDLTRQAWGFIRRHRRSIMVGVGVGVVGYAAWKAKKLLDEYKRMIQELDLARFEQHR
jgi:hypothetical protein